MPAELIDFAVQLGISGVAFACFYLIHKSSTTQIDEILKIQSERAKESNEQMNKIIDFQTAQQNKMFEILKSMIEQNNLQLAYLQEIKTAVGANLWCPVVRKNAGLESEEK